MRRTDVPALRRVFRQSKAVLHSYDIVTEVCQFFCVNDQVLFLGWEREGRGQLPLPSLSDFRKGLQFMTPAAPKPAFVPATEW